MSDSTPSFPDFGKFVPGFDFLHNLATQSAGSAAAAPQLPGLGSWIAPTINIEELDKRIQELKAVQFWLDQNAAALKATIQALEVQKMTLSTLKGMNFNMAAEDAGGRRSGRQGGRRTRNERRYGQHGRTAAASRRAFRQSGETESRQRAGRRHRRSDAVVGRAHTAVPDHCRGRPEGRREAGCRGGRQGQCR